MASESLEGKGALLFTGNWNRQSYFLGEECGVTYLVTLKKNLTSVLDIRKLKQYPDA